MESLPLKILTCLPLQTHPNTTKISPTIPPLLHKQSPILHHHTKSPQTFSKLHLPLISSLLSFPLPALAAEPENIPSKINIEAILISIDEFFNRYPFFVAGVTFIWLVVIPLAEEYFQKYKFISAVDAFTKLRDDPNSQLLDVRDSKSLAFLPSPNLKMLNKSVMQVEFREGEEDQFVEKVLESFPEPENSTVCVLDNFDGNSMKVAELLVKQGLKEAYAIRGGIRGKKGWQEIQETLLPPSVHIYPKKKVKGLQKQDSDSVVVQPNEVNSQSTSVTSVTQVEQTSNGSITKSVDPTSATKSRSGSLSPYPNYPDLKPPSSPTPSKPQS